MPETKSDELKILFPGRVVRLGTRPDGQAIEATVYPIGVWHIRQFRQELSEGLAELASAVFPGGVPAGIGSMNADGLSDELVAVVAAKCVPIVIGRLLPVIAACVEGVDLSNPRVPAHLFPPLAAAWIEESFGSEDRIRPWIELMEKGLAQMTGKPTNLWERFSRSWSRRAISSTPSPDGGSPSSGTSPATPPASSDGATSP